MRVALLAALLPLVWTLQGAAAAEVELIRAVRDQNRPAIRALIESGADVNARQADGATALHWAAYWNDADTIARLLRARADANAADDLGVTPLLLAARNGNTAIGEALLAAGARAPTTALATGETPLMAAARTDASSLVQALIERGAAVDAVESARGQSALMWAAGTKHPGAVKALLDAGAKVSLRTKVRSRLVYVGRRNAGSNKEETDRNQVDMPEGGNSALLFAARSGDPESARLLLNAGAGVDDAGADGRSALLVAALSGNGQVAAALLEHGADSNLATAGYAPLHAAVLRGDLALVRALLEHGARPDVALERGMPVRRRSHDYAISSDFVGITPYLLAAKYLEVEMMQALVDAGANPRAQFKDGTTAVMFAAGVGSGSDRRELEYLAESLNAGRGYDSAREEAQTLAAVRLAVSLGGNVNAVSSGGDTALHASASRGHGTVIQFLADSGADLSLRDGKGRTALAVALGEGRTFSTSATVASGGDGGQSTVEAPAVAVLRRLGAK